jgi:glycosyltransferase involved in cell wall biosynthesis
MTSRTIVISVNAAWNLLNFRRELIAALQLRGHEVVALVPEDENSGELAKLGVRFVPIAIDSQGMSPLADLMLLRRYRAALKAIRPDLFLGYTIKPNIYGSIAARSLGVPAINNISGLGTAFIRTGLLTRLVKRLYRFALARSATVFFQNAEDREQFLRERIVRPEQARLLPGSGIAIDLFTPQPMPDREGFTFLLLGRLLWDKGVREFVEAARHVRRDRPGVGFQLLGFLDVPNRTAVGRADIEGWVAEGVVEYLGASDDVRPHIAAADCIVLPSYREGLPRSLLEGAAMAKPLIATDVPGCRQVVGHKVNGLLCAARDPDALAAAMRAMIDMPADRRCEMGNAGRRKVEAEYDERIVIDRYLEAIDQALSTAQSAER